MKIKSAGKHKMTYRDVYGYYKVIYVSHVSTPSTPWRDVTGVQIPVGKVAFIKCPECNSNDWEEDSQYLNGFSCGGCNFELLVNGE